MKDQKEEVVQGRRTLEDIPSHQETLQASEIAELVSGKGVVLEIGSHEGTDTVKLAKAMPSSIIHCFECEQRAIVRFLENTKDYDNIRLYETAIADTDGEADFYASTGKAGKRDDWDFSGSLNKPTGHYQRSPDIKFKEPQLVRTTQLDTWWESMAIFGIDFIWADIQGAQLRMLRGAHLALRVTKYLYLECHQQSLYRDEPSQETLIDVMYCFGFEPVAVYGKDNILFENTQKEREQNDSISKR